MTERPEWQVKRECAHCGREFLPKHHSQVYHSAVCLRKARLADWQKIEKKPMDDAEYGRMLRKLDLGINEAATIFGFSPRNARRYASGEIPIPPPLAKLMRLMVREDIATKTIERL